MRYRYRVDTLVTGDYKLSTRPGAQIYAYCAHQYLSNEPKMSPLGQLKAKLTAVDPLLRDLNFTQRRSRALGIGTFVKNLIKIGQTVLCHDKKNPGVEKMKI